MCFRFCGHKVSIASAQGCHFKAKESTAIQLHSHQMAFTVTGGGQDLARGLSLVNPCSDSLSKSHSCLPCGICVHVMWE